MIVAIVLSIYLIAFATCFFITLESIIENRMKKSKIFMIITLSLLVLIPIFAFLLQLIV